MKKITLFLLTILISCSAWAVNITNGTQLFLKPNSNWKTDNARFAAYFFGSSGISWASMKKVDGAENIYEVTAPSGTWSNVIFCRMNPSSSTNDWNNKWNQTGDLTFDGTKDLFTITQWDNQTSGWSKCFTLSFNNETDYNVGEYYKPDASCTNLTNPTYAYKVNGNSVDILDEGYLFKQGGTFEFTIEAKDGSTTRATETHTITINPTVKFDNTTTEYAVGEYFKPEVSSTKINTPTYSYQIDGTPIEIPAEGYRFNEAGNFTFTVEVKYNNDGDVLASDTCTVTVNETAPAHVKFNNNPEDEYKVGTTFHPLVESENIENATYTYFVNDEETNISNGYTFLNAGTFVFRVEARSNGEGDVLADATHTVTINSTISLESKTEYSVGETYLPTVTSTGILNPTYSYSVEFEGNTTDITGNDYIFQDKGTYLFTVNALYNGNVIVSDTQEITIAPTVEITNASEVYYVGDTFTPEPSATSILNPTYSYKLNGEEIVLENGYTFTEEGDYTLTVEVKNNGEGNVLATKDYTFEVTIRKILYLTPNANWKADGARFAAYFFGNGETWISMTAVEGETDLYSVEVPAGYPNVIFCRMNPGAAANNWDNKWNQTDDLTVPIDGTNHYTVKSGTWDKGGGTWTTYAPDAPVSYIDITITVVANAQPKIHYWDGGDKMVGSDANAKPDMVATGDVNTYSYTIKDVNSALGVKYHLVVGDVQSADLHTTTNVTANFKDLLPQVAVMGVNNWDSGDKMTVSDDYKTATITLNLAAKTYEWKLTVNSEWFGGSKYTITRDKNSVDVTDNGDGNGKLTADKDGDYLFTYTYATKNLTVTYPVQDVTFSDPSTLTIGETYGKLSYLLEMPNDRWYWIVLPYNVNVSEITTTGANGNYNDLVFTEYDAQTRAGGGNGWINWSKVGRYNGDQVLQANKGYVIGPKTKSGETYNGITVIFPSVSTTNIVAREATDLTATNTGGTTINDNWNIIGTGLYHEGSLSDDINYVAIPDNAGDYNYYYISSPIDDLKQLTSFAPFEAFFVQYGGPYSATATVATTSAELAPVARAKAQEQEQIYLINMNEAHTVVILNAEGSEGYTAGEDFLEMNVGSRIEMIYSFDAEDALAFNHRATEAQSIALGGYVAVAGEQTISLDAYNGNAEAVTLIDNVNGTTTDLLAEDYTFTAEVGSLDGRFTIVFAAQKAGSDTTVDCYNSIANQVIAYGTADHCTVSGLTAGEAIVVYNTMGQLVFATTADSETITLPSLTAGNYLILHNGTTNKVTLR